MIQVVGQWQTRLNTNAFPYSVEER